MIRKIEFNNFYSFKDKQTINFLTSKNRTYDYGKSQVDKKQITTIAGVISKNAAGKTNLMRIFGFLGVFVNAMDRGDGNNMTNAYKSFFKNRKSTNFSIEFEIGTDIYVYSFSIKNFLLDSESLRKGKEIIYSYSYDKKNNTLNPAFNMDVVTEKMLQRFTRKMSFIAFVNSLFEIEELSKVSSFFGTFFININELGQRRPEEEAVVRSSKMYLENKVLKKEMEEFVNNFDLGPKKSFTISFKEKEKDGEKVLALELYSLNAIVGVNEKLPFLYESTGTRMIYYMLSDLFTVLKTGGVLIVDEVESGLHPEALSKLIDYFISENINCEAQFIFSTHDLNFLKKFKKDQVFLIEKNSGGESNVYRLDEKSEKNGVKMRTEDNLYTKYNLGLYGSYPHITA